MENKSKVNNSSELTITRRVFIGATALVVSAPLFAYLPNSSIGLKNVLDDGQFFNAKQLTVLTDVAEIMIPSTDTPGAIDAQVIPVLDSLMLTWAGTKTKEAFVSIIEQIQLLAKNTFNTTYDSCALVKRTNLISELDKQSFANTGTTLSRHYRKLKETIFHIYYTSEEANPDFILVPGTYKGCLSKSEYDLMVDKRLGRST